MCMYVCTKNCETFHNSHEVMFVVNSHFVHTTQERARPSVGTYDPYARTV